MDSTFKNREPLTYTAIETTDSLQCAEEIRFVKVKPANIILPAPFAIVGERIQNMEIRKDDIWIVAYPRTGSNWLQEMVWLIANDLNFNEANNIFLSLRSILIEGSAVAGHLYEFNGEWGNIPDHTVEVAENMKSPRHMKSHLPFDMLPTSLGTVQPKILYMARNPKDVCVSYYMYLKLTINLQNNFETFCEEFMKGTVPYGNYLHHVLNFWNKRHQQNVLFLTYEDLKKDLEGGLHKIATFLGKDIQMEGIKQLVDHLSFQKMRCNPAVNRDNIMEAKLGPDHVLIETRFIRKGEVGDWNNYMNPDISEKFDSWAEETLKGTGLSFSYL